MLTLKHFLDKPLWAAAAGYAFSYMDCMAFTAKFYDNIFAVFKGLFNTFLDTEIRELPMMLAVIITAISGVIIWPFIFWLVAIFIWCKCRKTQRKYRHGKPAVVRENLESWQKECEKKWRMEGKCF